MTREEIYQVLEGEEDYQIKKWGENHDKRHTIGDFLVYMEAYLNAAKAGYTFNSAPEGAHLALDQMRKVVELGIACFKAHGVPEREVI